MLGIKSLLFKSFNLIRAAFEAPIPSQPLCENFNPVHSSLELNPMSAPMTDFSTSSLRHPNKALSNKPHAAQKITKQSGFESSNAPIACPRNTRTHPHTKFKFCLPKKPQSVIEYDTLAGLTMIEAVMPLNLLGYRTVHYLLHNQ
jgi:hypothetical protein